MRGAAPQAIHPDGRSLVAGSRGGALLTWQLPEALLREPPREAPPGGAPAPLQSEPLRLGGSGHSEAIDGLVRAELLRLL